MAGAEDDPVARAQVAALLEGLQELGWTQGRDIELDYRWAAANSEEFPLLAKQLVAGHPDVIVSVTTTAAAALKEQTNATRPCSPRSGHSTNRVNRRPRRAALRWRTTGDDRSLRHLVCPHEQRLRDRQADRLGGFHVDDEFELCRPLDRELGRGAPFRNLTA